MYGQIIYSEHWRSSDEIWDICVNKTKKIFHRTEYFFTEQNYLIVYLRSERYNNTKMLAILFQKCLKHNFLQIFFKLGIWDVVRMTLVEMFMTEKCFRKRHKRQEFSGDEI